MNIAITLKNVYKTYNKIPIVKDLSLTIEKGEIFGLLGANGAGKSITIRMLITLAKPSQGQINVSGYDVSRHASKVKENIGVVLQQTSVDGELVVWENLEFQGRMHHISYRDRQNRINRWLGYVGLSDRRTSLVETMSGGTKLLSTHYMEKVQFLCDRCGNGKPGRIGIMDTRKLIESGTLTEFRSRYGKTVALHQTDNGLDYLFFADKSAANSYLESLPDRTGVTIRDSNLDDIFVDLTGHQLN